VTVAVMGEGFEYANGELMVKPPAGIVNVYVPGVVGAKSCAAITVQDVPAGTPPPLAKRELGGDPLPVTVAPQLEVSAVDRSSTKPAGKATDTAKPAYCFGLVAGLEILRSMGVACPGVRLADAERAKVGGSIDIPVTATLYVGAFDASLVITRLPLYVPPIAALKVTLIEQNVPGATGEPHEFVWL